MKNLLRVFFLSTALLSSSVFAGPPDSASDIKSHLEYNGYSVEVNDQRLLAKHPSKPNISMKKYNAGILFTSSYIANDNGRNNRDRLVDIVNELNQDAVAVRFYIDKDGDMIVEAYYAGAYDKANFGILLEKYNLFQAQLSAKMDELKTLLK
jgi:hypothetical protein